MARGACKNEIEVELYLHSLFGITIQLFKNELPAIMLDVPLVATPLANIGSDHNEIVCSIIRKKTVRTWNYKFLYTESRRKKRYTQISINITACHGYHGKCGAIHKPPDVIGA